jgi:transcriptional regulator with XRE-family HTH domain
MTENILLKLGSNIKKIRQELGLSQEELADLTKLHRTYIGGVERGERNIGIINLAKIANSLGVPLTKLLNKIDSNLS